MTSTGFTAHRLGRIGRAMARSMRTVTSTAALSQVTRHLDLTTITHLREQASDPQSVTAYLLRALAAVLPDHPLLNGRLDDDAKTVQVADQVNLGVAVATDEGLIVPVIHSADRLDLAQIADAVDRLAAAARDGSLTVDDVTGGTFTISNLGMYGVEGGFAIPPPPQGAILLVGTAQSVFEPDPDGNPVARTKLWCGLTFDHRFIDGAAAAGLLADLAAAVANPTTFDGEP